MNGKTGEISLVMQEKRQLFLIKALALAALVGLMAIAWVLLPVRSAEAIETEAFKPYAEHEKNRVNPGRDLASDDNFFAIPDIWLVTEEQSKKEDHENWD